MTKCCPYHPAAASRSARRAADRVCPCRGECDSHPSPKRPALTEKENCHG